jgi:hypothetical protein
MVSFERDLGTITVEELQARNIDWSYFVEIDIKAPVGLVRFTNRKRDFVGELSGDLVPGNPDWILSNMNVGSLDQGRQSASSVSQIDFANLDWTWTNWANTPGLRKSEIRVWVGWFNADGATLSGYFLHYAGRIDNHRCGVRAELALKPGRAKWKHRVLAHISGKSPLLPAPLMPEDGTILHRRVA